MHVVLIYYCRPGVETHSQTLRPWLEQQVAKLSAQPHVRRTAIVYLTTAGSERGDPGWLLECELDGDAGARSDTLRELLTDMRLVGFHPLVFTAQPPTEVPNAAAVSVSTDAW